MAKASASIDISALKVAGEANKYITHINGGGITVHDAVNQNLNYVKIDSNGMEIFKSDGAAEPSAVSIANFGENVRIGHAAAPHLIADTNGITLFGDDGSTQLARFDEEIILGSDDINGESAFILLNQTEYDSQMNLVFKKTASGEDSAIFQISANYDDGSADISCLGTLGDIKFRNNETTISSGTTIGTATTPTDLHIRTDGFNYDGPNKILWNGTASFMTETQTVNLSENVSYQLTGIVLVWSRYANSAAQNDSWWYEFIPKWHTSAHNGGGVYMTTPTSNTSNVMCHKYIYVYNDRLTGHANNSATGTGYANNTRALRAVLGV